MMKKTLIATATAGLIAAGAMVATTGTASAAASISAAPAGASASATRLRPQRPQRECRPVLKTVRWWDNWGRPHFKQVVVGQDCAGTTALAAAGTSAGPNPGWGYGPNPGWGWRH